MQQKRLQSLALRTFQPSAGPLMVSTNTTNTMPRLSLDPVQEIILHSILTSSDLERNYPELLWQVPRDLRRRVEQADPTVWADLLRRKPELFRHWPFKAMEDIALDFLLGKIPEMPDPKAEEPVHSGS